MLDIPKFIAICLVAAILIASFFPDYWEGLMNSNCAMMGGQPVKTEHSVACVKGDK